MSDITLTTDTTFKERWSAAVESLRSRVTPISTPLVAAGAAVLIVASFLSWSYSAKPLDNLSINFNPGAVQIQAILLGLVALGMLLLRSGKVAIMPWANTAPALRTLGYGSLFFMVVVVGSIALETGGLINIEPGGWLALVGALLLAAGGFAIPPLAHTDPLRARHKTWASLVAIIALLAIGLFGSAYALNIVDGATFLVLLVFAGAVALSFARAGAFQWLSIAAAAHRQVLMLGALAVAFLFPLTQNGSNANMSIATQIIIFTVTALGLNIVVGLAGLLDLGYIAFLGAGAYVGAMMSSAALATISWKPPFIVVMIIGGLVASVLGLIIGSPTLRVSGDYLAIVTLAFGEIFRITVNNLDGGNGPDLTHGPNGIPNIPDLVIPFVNFDFGQEHDFFGIPMPRFANYYFLLLIVLAFVIVVFMRLNNSRIGRGWVAIREDERAAEAMGVNVFGLKLFAFAGGAFLAGLTGTIKAHQDQSVTPDQFIFLESAFLLAAVVLGGMGTVAGVLIGSTILKLLPEKLRFISDYRLLMFGVLLVVMMRYRPEGIVASRQRQLEFHEEDEGLAAEAQEEIIEQSEATS